MRQDIIKFCKNCLMPSSRPRISFKNNNLCNACEYLLLQKKINWKDRKQEFLEIIKKSKTHEFYDCIVPWSGGKDSSFIAYKLKFDYNLNPLLVTFAPILPTKVGHHNRNEMIKLGFDHIYFTPDHIVSKQLSKRFFIERGNPKVHWDAGIKSLPIKTAIEKNIKLIVYAEHGESHYGGLTLYKDSSKNLSLEDVLENNIGDNPLNWESDEISKNQLYPYILPDLNKSKNKFHALFFAYFHKWNVIENYNFIINKINFKTHPKGRTPGTFTNFDSLDDHVDQIYYYLQFIKFGFGRASRDASRHIQKKAITKSEYFNYVKKYDHELSKDDMIKFCQFIEISVPDFHDICDKHRNAEIWKRKKNKWKLKFNINNHAKKSYYNNCG
jgi:N-acetyl sugar amidotransferase